MSSYAILKQKILKKQAKICVVGLGYVGLPLAVAFSQKGYRVYGFDTNTSRIERLKKGQPYIVDISPREVTALIKKGRFVPTPQEKAIGESDVIIICVPTPLRKVKTPDVSYIAEATKTIRKFLKKGQLIILESTSYPTTTREVVLPLLKESGIKEEEDFFLCFSPERVNPGDKKFPLVKISKIVGGLSDRSTRLAQSLYARIIGRVTAVSSPEVAEMSKLLENTFRLVNIALVNEFALCCHKLGISIWEVIEAAKTKPFGFTPFYPGPGIGGHCIPVDPLYLSWKAKNLGFKTKMIDLASYVNHFMPKYVVVRVEDLLKEKGVSLARAKILILGVAYKKDVRDLRESPALEVIKELTAKGAQVDFHDPLIPYLRIKGIDLKGVALEAGRLKNYDCIIVITDHSAVDYDFIKKNAKCIFDTRNTYKREDAVVKRL